LEVGLELGLEVGKCKYIKIMSEEIGIIMIYNLLLRITKFERSMKYVFKTIIVQREASFGPEILARDRHLNVESKKAILQ
jgi:hypothetical protein